MSVVYVVVMLECKGWRHTTGATPGLRFAAGPQVCCRVAEMTGGSLYAGWSAGTAGLQKLKPRPTDRVFFIGESLPAMR